MVSPTGRRGAAWPVSGITARRRPKEFAMLKFLVFVQGYLSEPLRRDDRGVTSVEYGLLVALIAVGVIAAVSSLRDALIGVFTNVTSTIGGG
jgi:pilus assembly protein Flp/PilA